jgi:hypothetical protein
VNTQSKIWPVLRDVIIVTVLSGLGGFIVGFASTDHSSRVYFYGLALSNSLFCIIGFTISGCLAVGNRWRHLAIVAAIVWAVSIFNVIFFGVTIIQWAASVIAVAIFALIGGGLSFLFKSKKTDEGKLDQTHNQRSPDRSTPAKAGDDKFYDEVARELEEKPMVPGLWTKAFAEMDGDDAKARALYIRYRVQQLATEAARQHESVEEKRKREVTLIQDRLGYLRRLKLIDDEGIPNSQFDGISSKLAYPVNASFVADALSVTDASIIIAIRTGNITGVRCDGEWFVDLGIV